MSPIPRATARLQLHSDFTFADAERQVPYFAALGISHLYLSPILTARKGSRHGYDVVDHGTINPELGGDEGLQRLVATVRRHNLGVIVDIVSNHMAVGEDDNAWWLDVLEWGRRSRYAAFFDIDWDVPDPALNQRLLAPFLGKPYGEALRDGEIQLQFDSSRGKFHFAYYSHRFPLAPASYARVWPQAWPALRAALRSPRAQRAAAFAAACAKSADAGGEAIAAQINQQPAQLHRLLERQHYRLAWFRTAADEINWRRFFDVIQLAGLRVEENAVFEAVHATTLRLYAAGLIDGLRIDHVDGLSDPRAYCRKLRARLDQLAPSRPAGVPPGPAYLVVEKILAPEERLPRDWRVHGSTGYAFMNDVGALLHDDAGEGPLNETWSALTGAPGDFDVEQRSARRRIARELFGSDFHACAQALHRIARREAATRDWTLAAIKRVLLELLVQFPVYRTYADGRGRSADDQRLMAQVVAAAAPQVRAGEKGLLELIDRWLGAEPPQAVRPAAARRLRLRAIARFQQLSAPVAAKSVEDTAFYRHGRLLSRNEVGANPAQFALTPAAFHETGLQRARRFPHTMLATATHDHKRGEDLRARLAVLSEIPSRWQEAITRWRDMNQSLRPSIEGQSGPDAGDEYMLYQTLAGAWPLSLQPRDREGVAALFERVARWQEKALREAKRHSGWIEPNLAYEQCCSQFLGSLAQAPLFLADLHRFAECIAAAGAVNGLAQTLLRLTTPGVPDLYQGTEFWDLSLVDPDNRSPVDFGARLAGVDHTAEFRGLLACWRDGRVKQRLIRNVLRCRADHAALFRDGAYLPLDVSGTHGHRVVAFARTHGGKTAVVVAPRCAASLLADNALPSLEGSDWRDTVVHLPAQLDGQAMEVISAQRLTRLGASFSPQAVLSQTPAALLFWDAPQR